jgi:HlyD family secretion protein
MSLSVFGKIVPLLIVASIAGGGYYWWQHRPVPVPVFTTVTVNRADLTQSVTATGTLQSVTSIDVSSQISGLISEVLVDYNSPVHVGDVLARIEPSTYQQRLKQAEADAASATAAVQLARINATRTAELRSLNTISQQELDQAKSQLDQAEAALLTKQAALANARVDLDRCTITAPIDGIVLDRATEKGKTVAASLNAPTLFTIVNDLTKMQIIASVSEADIGAVELAQPATFTVDAYPSRTFNGTISQIRNAPRTVSNVVTYDTVIAVDNSDLKLRPGMTANVGIIVARRNKALAVANTALRVRVPDAILATRRVEPPAPPSGEPPPPRPMTDDELRTARREILREAGFTFDSRPSPEVLAKAAQIAKARGLDIDFTRRPESSGSNGSGDGARPSPQVSAAAVTRTVFRLIGTDPATARIQPVTIKLGITDGFNTEVLDTLAEGDVVLTSASAASTAGTAAAGGNNPFAPPRMGPPRR